MLTGSMYREDCLKQHLVPFLEDYFFWSTLRVATMLMKLRISLTSLKFLLNPINSPQLQHITMFWEILKAKVYDGGWEVKTFIMLRQRIQKTLMEIDISLCQKLFPTLKTKIQIAADKGVMAVMWLAEINQDIKLMI